MPGPHIIIVGAGPSGLTLARLLQVNKFSFTLYEREASSSARFQGGSLDLHPESGQKALLEGGLMDEFNRYARYDDQDYRIIDKHGKDWMFHRAPPDATGRPEIDRPLLRQILVESIEPKHLQWNHAVKSIEPTKDGKFEVFFADDKGSAVADLVVGADGTWSRVRNLLTDIRPTYAKMTMVDCRMVNVDKDHPEIGKFIGRGTMFAFSDGRGIIAQRMGDDVIRVYPCLKVPERWWPDSGFEWDKPDRIKEKMLAELYHDWHPRLQDIIRHAEPAFTPRPLYRMPLGFHWKTQKGLTLVGDAAHVISPFAGEGVNLAMLDSLDLFHAIRDHPGDLEAAVAEYEALIPGRTDETNALAQGMMDMAMRDDAPKAYADEMNKAFEGLVPGWTETTA